MWSCPPEIKKPMDMKIKMTHHEIWLACMAGGLLLAACTAGDEPAMENKPAVVYPELRIGVSDMTMTAVSRASDPMSPDVEKYVRTIAVFEFDDEGLHEKGSDTYHFIDFVAGTVDGKSSVDDKSDDVDKTEYGVVETTLKGIAFKPYDDGTICLVANVPEDSVSKFYDKYREPGQSYGRMTLDRFKTWALPFEYEEIPEDVYDESKAGHLKNMYMFGYYQGEVKPAESGNISMDLGRLASRLDITVVNETGRDLDKRFGYHFDNVCSSAYFFPIKMSMPPTFGAGMTRTVICSGDEPVEGDDTNYKIVPRTFPDKASHTRYFYVAAHSAQNYGEATKLHLFYDRKIESDDGKGDENSVWVPLCNVHPSEADRVTNGYSLSRNTRYHFTIRLKNSATAAHGKAAASGKADGKASGDVTAAAPFSVEYGGQPGEINVYLPL